MVEQAPRPTKPVGSHGEDRDTASRVALGSEWSEFGRFRVERHGARWIIREVGSDGIKRDIHPIAGRFWRWVTAARLASCLNTTWWNGNWSARREV